MTNIIKTCVALSIKSVVFGRSHYYAWDAKLGYLNHDVILHNKKDFDNGIFSINK